MGGRPLNYSLKIEQDRDEERDVMWMDSDYVKIHLKGFGNVVLNSRQIIEMASEFIHDQKVRELENIDPKDYLNKILEI